MGLNRTIVGSPPPSSETLSLPSELPSQMVVLSERNVLHRRYRVLYWFLSAPPPQTGPNTVCCPALYHKLTIPPGGNGPHFHFRQY